MTHPTDHGVNRPFGVAGKSVLWAPRYDDQKPQPKSLKGVLRLLIVVALLVAAFACLGVRAGASSSRDYRPRESGGMTAIR